MGAVTGHIMEKVAFVLLVAWAATQAVPVDKQIVSGEDAADCEFPHMAFLDITLSDDGISYCGATLLSSTHVLTAAHCIKNDVKSIVVHLGSNRKYDPSTAIPVRQWTKHSRYVKGSALLNDVAMLQLSRPVQFSSCIQPIDLPKKGDVFTGTCIAAGWGKTGNKGHYPMKMRRTDINVIPTKECKQVAFGIRKSQHICVGDQTMKGNNVCNGDSGGGLICQRPDGTPVVAGVASYVFDCDSGFGVFANVENFLDFIEDHMAVWQ